MSLFMLDITKFWIIKFGQINIPLGNLIRTFMEKYCEMLKECGVDLDHLFEMEKKDIGTLIRYALGGRL